jgi:PP-loop family
VQSTQEHNIHASTIGIILTAHHQDDSYESALLKLLRGVHLLNWKGMDPFMQLKAPAAPVPMRIGNSCSNTNDTAQLQPIYLARPFLEHSKQSLMEYLQKRNLQWREDTSNKLNKYLRNRVRNELIPLLQDMTDGAFLGKRLPNLLEQSYEMARDVNDRVNEYMNHYQPDAMALGLWTIHKESNSESQLIYSQALHQWITYRMVELNSANAGCNREHMVTYNLLQRVMEQLQEYPDRNQWELEMGNKYSVMRKGNVLRVVLAEPDKAMKTKKPPRVTWKWTIVHCAETQSSIPDVITLCLPQSMVSSDLSFFSTTISDASQAGFFGDESGVSLRFLPPWKSKPVKVRQFLHGQNIPLHQRDAIPMLFAVTQQSSPTLVAILVKPDKWIADKRYNLQTDTKDRAMDSYLQLQLTLGTIDA